MRHIILVPILDDSGPEWHGGTPAEQGYKHIALPKLKRHNAQSNEYYVYSSEMEYKSVTAESAVDAVAASQIKEPFKVVHAHSRIASVVETSTLEYIGQEETTAAAQDVAPQTAAPVAPSEPEKKI